MITSRIFFMVLAILSGLVGLLAAAVARDYLQIFGLGLFGFGVLYTFGCVKRHFDEQDAGLG